MEQLMTGCLALMFACSAAMAQPNAALGYWRAFEIAPDDFEAAIQEAYRADPAWRPTEEVAALLAEQQGSIAMMVRAAAIGPCDFQVEKDQGLNALMPEAGLMRRGSKILAADARRLLATGDVEAAAERVAAMLAMGEHASHGSFLISSLVGCAIMSNASAEAGLLIDSGKLTPAGRRALAEACARFDAGDPFSFRSALLDEKSMVLGWVRSFRGPDAGMRLYAEATNSGLDQAESDDLAALKAAGDRELAPAILKLGDCYDSLVRAWEGPDAEAALQRLGKEAAEGRHGPLARLLIPAMDKAWKRDQEGRAALRELGARLRE